MLALVFWGVVFFVLLGEGGLAHALDLVGYLVVFLILMLLLIWAVFWVVDFVVFAPLRNQDGDSE